MSEPIGPCPQCNKDGFIAVRRPSGVVRYITCHVCGGSGLAVKPETTPPSWLVEWKGREDWRDRK